jgi:hypothetical protein
MAILGINFLRANRLSVDPAGGKLVQEGTDLILLTIKLRPSIRSWPPFQQLFLSLKHCNENPINVFHIHVSVSDLYSPGIGLQFPPAE